MIIFLLMVYADVPSKMLQEKNIPHDTYFRKARNIEADLEKNQAIKQ